MPFRPFGGSSGVSNFYVPVKPVLEGTRTEKFKPAKVGPGKFKPVKDKPQKTPTPALSQVEPPPPTRLPSPPPKWVSAPVPDPPAYSAPKSPLRNVSSSLSLAKSSAVSGPTAQPPPTPGPIPGPSTQNELKSQKSVPTLLSAYRWSFGLRTEADRTLVDGRSDGRSSSFLAASKSNPALNKQNLEPPNFRPDSPSTTPTQTPRARTHDLWPAQPHYSSLLNNQPIRPPSVNIPLVVTVILNLLFAQQKTEKSGFFGRLFGFGKSKPNEPKVRRPANKLTKSTTPSRPVSIASVSPAPEPSAIRY